MNGIATPAPSETATPAPQATTNSTGPSRTRKSAFQQLRQNERTAIKAYVAKYIEQNPKARMVAAEDRERTLMEKMEDKLREREGVRFGQAKKKLARQEYPEFYCREVEERWLKGCFGGWLYDDVGEDGRGVRGGEEEMDDEEPKAVIGAKGVKTEGADDELEDKLLQQQMRTLRREPVEALSVCRRDHMVWNESEEVAELRRELQRKQIARVEACGALRVWTPGFADVRKERIRNAKRKVEGDEETVVVVVAKRSKVGHC